MTKSLLAAGLLTLLTACSGAPSESHPRDPEFFKPLLNPSEKFESREKMGELKILASSEKYDMRYALFEDGRFYYEVGNLGNGVGEWSYRDGKISLHAVRSFFDLDLEVGAAQAAGDDISVFFYDRYGRNTVAAQLKKPVGQALKPVAPPQNPKL